MIILFFPFKVGLGPSLEQTWILLAVECFVLCFVKIGPVVLKKKMNMWKVYNDNNDDTNNGHILIIKSSIEPSARVAKF